MIIDAATFADIWSGLVWPLARLVFFICLGLAIGNMIEALNWTHQVARLATPLIRMARLKDISGASFSLAFFSGVSANTMLAESYDQGKISRKELILSNLFNSLPTYFLHLPTLFFITAPFIGTAAIHYVGITLASAVFRTGLIVVVGHMILPPIENSCVTCILNEEPKSFAQAIKQAIKRLKGRIPKIIKFTIPIYTAIYVLKTYGAFAIFQNYLAEHVGFLSWLPTEALGIVVFHVSAEFTAGLAVAGALIHDGGLTIKQVVLALVVGNVLSSPMRAFRHQFPYYAGIFKPKTAMELILFNQTLRAATVSLMGFLYWVAW